MLNLINHCTLAHPDPNREQQYKYAYGIRYRLQNGLATQFDIKQELNKRSDQTEIRQILEGLKDGGTNKARDT